MYEPVFWAVMKFSIQNSNVEQKVWDKDSWLNLFRLIMCKLLSLVSDDYCNVRVPSIKMTS